MPFDLLGVPGAGRLLRWRHARTFLQVPLFIVSIAMILHGLLGPTISPKNLATTLSWVHFRGALVLVLLCAGNFFCLACPFMLVRNFARRFVSPRLNWPRALRNKWLSLGLFVLVLFAYEEFALWSSPRWTALLILAYFAGAVGVDLLFKHASFCKFVCPIGQFNFVASTVSPLEVKVRDGGVCTQCTTKDCIRGRRTSELVTIQRGCELALFQPLKAGNMDCTFCLDCVQACPHDNVGILSRVPAEELTRDPVRSGIGRFSRRKDIAALGIVFSFGALLNAFGMVSPVYAVERWLAGVLHVSAKAPVLAAIFFGLLVVEPALLLGLAGWMAKGRQPLVPTIVRYSYALVPLGFGVWLAHYGFHFFTGLLTVIPLTQSVCPFLGQPLWNLTGLPQRFVQPLELGFLLLGFMGSLTVAFQLAKGDSPAHPLRAFLPWAGLCAILWISALWLMAQPMEMRATFLAG